VFPDAKESKYLYKIIDSVLYPVNCHITLALCMVYINKKVAKMKPRFFLIIIAFVMIFFSCGKDDNGPTGTDNTAPSIDVYFPIAKGAKWEYRVDFPQNCNVPYSPWFEYPEAMLGTSITHGMGSWNAGQIDFEMLINDIYETSSNSSTWDISLSELGLKFYFYRTDTNATQCRLHLTIENGNANLDLIAVLPIGDPNWVIARSLARVNSEDLNQTFDVSVPSGEYKNCVKSVVNIYGDGTYVPSGTYPMEIYLAPNVGVVKAVGKDRNGTILYTLELSNFNN